MDGFSKEELSSIVSDIVGDRKGPHRVSVLQLNVQPLEAFIARADLATPQETKLVLGEALVTLRTCNILIPTLQEIAMLQIEHNREMQERFRQFRRHAH